MEEERNPPQSKNSGKELMLTPSLFSVAGRTYPYYRTAVLAARALSRKLGTPLLGRECFMSCKLL